MRTTLGSEIFERHFDEKESVFLLGLEYCCKKKEDLVRLL